MIFQLLTACIAFAYDVSSIQFTGPSNCRVCFRKQVCLRTSRTRRCTHTKPAAPVLLPKFPPELSFHQRCFFLLPFIRDAYRMSVPFWNAKYNVNLNPAFPPPMTYINDESQTNHYELMCVTMESSRTLPQAILPVGNRMIASRERLNGIHLFPL